MSLKQLQILITLAKIDGILSKDEAALISKIAAFQGISLAELDLLYRQETGAINLATLDEDTRFDYLYTIVQLMKIDKRLYKEEFAFCRETAKILGYDDKLLYYFIVDISIEGGEKEQKKLRKKVFTIKKNREARK